jgi:protoporphyrinogen oxidase
MKKLPPVDFVVLGGGVSGLGFAKRVADHGKSVVVLEKEAVVGGLSRTLHHEGFYLDFCAHRFHTKNKALLDEIFALPGLKMERHIKKSRIYIFGKYLKYPFEIENLLRAMPLAQSTVAGFSFIFNTISKKFRKKKVMRSYKEWFIDIYGPKLYEVMCRPYTSKIWHHDPGEISADWADQRFQGENVAKLMKRIIVKILTLDFSPYSLEDDTLAPDGGEFYYPLHGIQELPDALALAAKNNGAEIFTNTTVTRVDTKAKTVEYQQGGEVFEQPYGQLISTIPLHTYYALQEREDKHVEEQLAKLEYMDIMFVFLFVDTPHLSNDHWLYFPDKEIIFNRATEYSNWSPEMCPPGKTSVCFDITAFADSSEWKMTDEALTERVISDAVRAKYLKREQVEGSLVTRIKYAYPYYDVDYKPHLDDVVAFLETPQEHLLGRTGIFRYNNSDNSIEMGFELAEKLLEAKEGQTISAHEYSVKEVSY